MDRVKLICKMGPELIGIDEQSFWDFVLQMRRDITFPAYILNKLTDFFFYKPVLFFAIRKKTLCCYMPQK